ncbi:hypothetical protein B0O80DRAFT_515860 [Mortierella sp. GBAus27b]|nr:hypothetical protein B0O80DRAFT_515860 [Mortierella sp. GBAus27b]
MKITPIAAVLFAIASVVTAAPSRSTSDLVNEEGISHAISCVDRICNDSCGEGQNGKDGMDNKSASGDDMNEDDNKEILGGVVVRFNLAVKLVGMLSSVKVSSSKARSVRDSSLEREGRENITLVGTELLDMQCESPVTAQESMEDIHMATPPPASANFNIEAKAEHGSKTDDIHSSLGTSIESDFGDYRDELEEHVYHSSANGTIVYEADLVTFRLGSLRPQVVKEQDIGLTT